MRRIAVLLVVVLAFAACSEPGGEADSTATTVARAPASQQAPDFTLALGEGGVFHLADEQKPVYMVFWAEW